MFPLAASYTAVIGRVSTLGVSEMLVHSVIGQEKSMSILREFRMFSH